METGIFHIIFIFVSCQAAVSITLFHLTGKDGQHQQCKRLLSVDGPWTGGGGGGGEEGLMGCVECIERTEHIVMRV